MAIRVHTAQVSDPKTLATTLSTPEGRAISHLTYTRSARAEHGVIEFPMHERTLSVQNDSRNGYWTLSDHRSTYMLAARDKWWRRNIDISYGNVRYVMTPVAAFRGDFVVKRVPAAMEMMGRHIAGDVVGTLTLVDRKTLSYELIFDSGLGVTLPAFCLWLVLLLKGVFR